VRFWSDEIEGTGFTADISDTGLLIETPKPLELGQRLHLEVSLNEGSYFAECVIVRRKTYPRHARALFKPAIGVRFLGLSEVAGVASAPDDEVPERAASVETAEASARVEGSTDPVPVEVPRGPMQVDLRELADLEAVYKRDIKHGGLLVQTREAPEIDSEVVVPVRLPDPHGTIRCHGTVVKVNENPPSVAVRLSEVKFVRDRVREILSARS
jgi:Tfp pilus assembly protein PilZ